MLEMLFNSSFVLNAVSIHRVIHEKCEKTFSGRSGKLQHERMHHPELFVTPNPEPSESQSESESDE